MTDNLREAAYDATAPANIVLDAAGALVMANEDARRTFGLGITDVGRPIHELELSHVPVQLKAHLDGLTRDGRAIDLNGVRWRRGDRERVLDVRVAPLMADGVALGTSITYRDVTDSYRLQEQLTSSRRELEQAYEELQSTVEELETTNEELQSTNEELETTNEELQSTNEELETMNEELQSSNEELETMNDELRHRSLELNEMNSFLETILTTIGLAVVVLDRRQQVQIWNGQARELWGVTSEEAEDQHFLSLDLGLPVEQLKTPIRACLAGDDGRHELTLPATNRRGRAFQCRVTCLPLGGRRDGGVSGVILMMEPVEEEAEKPAASGAR